MNNTTSLQNSSSSAEEDSDVQRPLKKGPWTSEEDNLLIDYLNKYGVGNWNSVQKYSGLSRCGKSCRLRWINNLRPGLRKGPLAPEEESKIIELHDKMGNKWSRIAAELPGRTDNEIKNFWNTRKKKLDRARLPTYPQAIGIRAAAATPDNQYLVLNHPESSRTNSFRVPAVGNVQATSQRYINCSSPHPSLERLFPGRPMKRPRGAEIIFPSCSTINQHYNGFYNNGHRSGVECPSVQYLGLQGGIRAEFSPLPPLGSVNTLIQSPSDEQAQSINCLPPWNNGFLETVVHESKATKNKTLSSISDGSASTLKQSAGSALMEPQSAETSMQEFSGIEGGRPDQLFCLGGFAECDCGYCGNAGNDAAEPSQSDNLSDLLQSL